MYMLTGEISQKNIYTRQAHCFSYDANLELLRKQIILKSTLRLTRGLTRRLTRRLTSHLTSKRKFLSSLYGRRHGQLQACKQQFSYQLNACQRSVQLH
jgi:hypothetical protein